MSDKSTLEARLARLASSGVATPNGRILRAGSSEALLSHLLNELLETVLPRRLRLGTAAGARVTLDAANGRIVRIVKAEDDAGPFGTKKLIGRDLDATDTGQADAIRSVFEALIKGVDTIAIHQEALEEQTGPEHAGLSVAGLAEAWDIALAQDKSGEAVIAVDKFLSSIQSDLAAWLMTTAESEVSESAGDPDTVDELTAFAEARRETGDAARQAAHVEDEPWSFLSVHRAPDAADVTVIILIDGVLLYVSIPKDRLAFVADAWRAAVAA